MVETKQRPTYLLLLLSTAYATWGVTGRKRRLSAACQNAWAGVGGGGRGGCCTKIVSL